MRPAARELLPYLVAFVVYLAIGISVPEFMLSWPVAVCYLLITVFVVPALLRIFR